MDRLNNHYNELRGKKKKNEEVRDSISRDIISNNAYGMFGWR